VANSAAIRPPSGDPPAAIGSASDPIRCQCSGQHGPAIGEDLPDNIGRKKAGQPAVASRNACTPADGAIQRGDRFYNADKIRCPKRLPTKRPGEPKREKSGFMERIQQIGWHEPIPLDSIPRGFDIRGKTTYGIQVRRVIARRALLKLHKCLPGHAMPKTVS
jgi:hypothetical protein